MGSAGAAGAMQAWIHQWLRELGNHAPASEFSKPDSLAEELARIHCASIANLATDPVVLRRLAVAEARLTRSIGPTDARVRIRRFLVEACWITHQAGTSSPVVSKRPSSRNSRERHLRTIAANAESLAKRLRTYSEQHPRSTHLTYLSERHQHGNPQGFNEQRKGMLAGKYADRDPKCPEPRLADLLVSAAADVLEEANALRLQIGHRRQTGGKLVRYHKLIEMLGKSSCQLHPNMRAKPDAALVTEVINTLLAPETPLDPGAVSKHLA